MAGETRKTTGVVVAIRPWSRTSHVVTWLTPDAGTVATVVKGAVRPKSAFLGQYDLFYTCEIVYYVGGRGELRPLREASALSRRDGLRGRWRETALAGYAAELVRELVPAGAESRDWFSFLERFLDSLAEGCRDALAAFVRLERGVLRRAGLNPDFSGASGPGWIDFSIERGAVGEGGRMVRIAPETMRYLEAPRDGAERETVRDAIRFLGLFIAYHLDLPADMRRQALLQART